MANTGKIQRIYQEYCMNGDGLSKLQAWTVLCEIGKNPTALEVNDFWEEQKLQEEDTITFEQFQELASKVEDPTTSSLKEAFSKFDNGDGTIEKEELRSILKASSDTFGTQLHLDDAFIDEVLKIGDTNGDGHLSIDELVNLVIAGELAV